ncbi:MAG TPA: 4-hydroxy-tetrahydrodipicolinate synthase [Salinivirgaceae bacterium]|nr:4-hydroxy-tetrahydrodipicolinate synthase [Salinivirgaceae bacterium]
MYFDKPFGLGTAIITPFNDDSSIDYPALKKHLRFQIENNVDYIVALGTTSESVTLSKEERTQVVEVILEEVKNHIPVIVGVGGYNTREIIKTIQELPKDVYGILSVTPYYNKPSQEGLYQHYREIALSTDKPIILYNVPGRTSVNMLPQTTIRLANDFKNIVAVKEASGIMTQIMEIIRQKPSGFQVLSGDDSIAYPLLAAGADGLISVIANAFPNQMSKLVHTALEGNFSEARKIHYKLLPLMLAIFEDGNPSGIKKLMNSLNLVQNNLRLPLVPVNNNTSEKIDQLVRTL